MTIPTSKPMSGIQIPDRLFFRIGDVAELLDVKPHVLRYWESEFPIVSPQKSSTGQRVYRRTDVETLVMIKHLLHEERYSIEGAKKRIRELRKEKGLKEFRQSIRGSAEAPAPSEASDESQSPDIQTELRELIELSRRPIADLFRF